LLHRYYNFSNGLLETQQIVKTDNFLIEFGPTLHCTGKFGPCLYQLFIWWKTKQIYFQTQHAVLGKLGFGQSALSCKIKESFFTRIDIIIALISQFFS